MDSAKKYVFVIFVTNTQFFSFGKLSLTISPSHFSFRLISNTFKDHTKNIAIWGGFLTSSLIVYALFSSGDFSFLLV